MKKIKYFTVTVFAILSFQINAQKIEIIKITDILSKVKEENLSIKISQEEINKAKAEFKQTNAIFLPSVSASHSGISTTNPLMAFGSKLNQGILTQADFNPALLNNPVKTENFSTRIEIEQPILNFDGIYQRKAAKSKVEAMLLQKQRKEEYLLLELEKTFMELQLAYKTKNVLETALKAANSNKEIAENNYNQGLIQLSDVLNVKVHLTEIENQLSLSISNIQKLSNYLSFLMNVKEYKVYKPSSSLILNSSELENIFISENRTDIKAFQFATDAYKAINKADKMSFLPRLNAFGSYELYDNKIFNGGANGYLIGAALSWDLFNGFKRIGRIQKSKAAYEKSKLEYNEYVSKSRLELSNSKQMLQDVKNNLRYSELGMQQSKESLRIIKNRFKQGLEKTNDLLMAEAKYAQKQLEYYAKIFQYNYTHKYIQFLIKE